MRAVAYSSMVLLALGLVVSCGGDDEEKPDEGSTAGSSTGGGSSMVSCPANPGPGDACTTNGTCTNASNCFCLSGTISCTDSPPQGGGGEPGGGGGDVDCGFNPETGDNCEQQGACDGAPECACDGDQVFCSDTFMIDCGDNPMNGSDCMGFGQCEGSDSCFCVDGEVVCQ
jgi:hypothetical protein